MGFQAGDVVQCELAGGLLGAKGLVTGVHGDCVTWRQSGRESELTMRAHLFRMVRPCGGAAHYEVHWVGGGDPRARGWA